MNIVNNNTDKFIISVENFNGVNFTSIANLNAPKYVFKNSSIVINNFQDWNNWNKNVLFDGNDNKLYITNSYTVQSGTYIRHTNSLTNIEVIIQDSDNLHKAKGTKYDEFYTTYECIEKEMAHYFKHFKNKIQVICL